MNQEKKNISQVAKDEEKVLEFWNSDKTFEKTLLKNKDKKEFIFFDGPPFATGLPHYGHILAGTIKDVLPRYKTMKGFHVKRKWGWDCHGLPIENIVEKKIGLNSKKEIEDFGIDKFNKECEESVLTYEKNWKSLIPKTGRWVDMSDPYKTMDAEYTESIWWVFSEIAKNGLLKKDFKIMYICPRCETSLSNNEVTDGYTDIKDLSVTAKFELEEEPKTFLLAWTTTPWTLPANTALVVSKDVLYVKVKNSQNDEKYIFAKECMEKTEKDFGFEFEILEEFLGRDILGKSYIPVFDYYFKNKDLKNHENGWKIYHADFVTTEKGTGIAHEAPAFGQEDLELGRENNLPWIQHVEMNGAFKKEVKDFAGMVVRKKDFHEEVDIEIIKKLAQENKLFFKEKFEHSYPLCWRCKTPLLNYATDSWFIETTKIKDKLVEENKKISWVPSNMGEKRFHNWLENTRDWAVSRSRYWGAPIPIWENKESGEYKVLSSLKDLKSKTRSKNNFVVFRHGQSKANVDDILSFEAGKCGDELTGEGKELAQKNSINIAEILKKAQNKNGEKIDVIISSPFVRTKQTSEIIKKEIGFEGEIIFDERIQETNFGKGNNGKSNKLFHDFIAEKDFDENTKICGGESYVDINRRVYNFLYEIDKKYEGKNILIVSHQGPINILFNGFDSYKKRDIFNAKNSFPYLFDFAPVPHDENYILNFHRPYIDKISFMEDGKKWDFCGNVFDCWFESGSMPYASNNFPFSKNKDFSPYKNLGFPANFIAEGTDQTRGWFYTMLVISVAIFGKSSFKNVIVNGTILAEDGKKMSKSENNFPDPKEVIDKYGADAIRFYMLSSQVVRGESMLFSEKGVDEIYKKVVMKIKNITSFYQIYQDEIKSFKNPTKSKNILDIWILEKTKNLVREVETGLEEYKLEDATKPFLEFIDDFSTWYIRRSRDRFKKNNSEDKEYALSTTNYVLKTFAKTIAPTTPFLAEYVWDIVSEKKGESVHLQSFPKVSKNLKEFFVKNNILKEMEMVREVVSLGLEVRSSIGIKVRQPLSSILVVGLKKEIDSKYLEIIKDELNVKEVIFSENIENAHAYKNFSKDLEEISMETENNLNVFLDKNITEDLKTEGDFREFLRQVQIMRKDKNLVVNDLADLKIDLNNHDDIFIKKYEKDLKKNAGIKNIFFEKIDDLDFVKINEKEIKIILSKI